MPQLLCPNAGVISCARIDSFIFAQTAHMVVGPNIYSKADGYMIVQTDLHLPVFANEVARSALQCT